MPASKPLKATVVVGCKLTAEEKARWDEYCEKHDVTLSEALRGGFKLYMRDLERLSKRREQADADLGVQVLL
jgi:hypothetical protein